MRHQFYLIQVKVLILLPLFAVALVACDRAVVHEDLRVEDGVTTVGPRKAGVFGEGGLFSLGGGSTPPTGMGSGIGVNAYLWRASLDTISKGRHVLGLGIGHRAIVETSLAKTGRRGNDPFPMFFQQIVV